MVACVLRIEFLVSSCEGCCGAGPRRIKFLYSFIDKSPIVLQVICSALQLLCTCIGCTPPPITARTVILPPSLQKSIRPPPAASSAATSGAAATQPASAGGHRASGLGGTSGARGGIDGDGGGSWGWSGDLPAAVNKACHRVWGLLQECDGIRVRAVG